ncbi:O-antigen polysaccharide polymerase Wzy [Sulfitobacter pontiacus]|uniref:O-antigen polysaccharide polymerase Wzy n=1 Tax=Sulfitobacter pontiacus TaxID=60137 RepID=UPI001F0EAB3D|nr:O-antigen polysaccharide polymerase Wzy [Sulfitobacter pontiacus]
MLCFTVGVALYYSPTISIGVAAFYSCFSAIICLIAAVSVSNKEQSWLFWFTVIYFLFYQFGTIFGTFLSGFDASFIDHPTNFSNSISNDALAHSYIVSGACISLIWSFAGYFPVTPPNKRLPFNKPMYQVGIILLALSTPFMLYGLAEQFNLVRQQGYAFLYTSGFQGKSSSIPGMSVINNANTLAFLVIFASQPSIKRFRYIAALFILISLIDALKGARSALIIPIIFLVWHASIYYNLRVRLGRSIPYIITVLIILIYWQVARNGGAAIGANLLERFLTSDISKAQHTLAVVLDNYDYIHVSSIFAFEPVTFPVHFLQHGSAIIGQSETTALLRHDLNHTFSSQLNYGAYIGGAGLGSAFAAESFQFGFATMLLFIPIWLTLNSYLFRMAGSHRLALLMQPILFMHIISSPRGTIFPATWPILKLLIMYMAVIVVIKLLPRKPIHPRRVEII